MSPSAIAHCTDGHSTLLEQTDILRFRHRASRHRADEWPDHLNMWTTALRSLQLDGDRFRGTRPID
ncbi:hypothetical protein BJI47_17535 [Rhodococcus sp. 1168]|nr:hypothetical protein BJI47_17535 [Rhodococcus sp. 1168]